MAVIQDIIVKQGTTHTEVFLLEVLADPSLPYDEDTNPYIPMNLTSAKIRMNVRKDYDSSAIVLEATSENGKFVKTFAGTFELRLLPSHTTEIRFVGEEATYVYDIEVEGSIDNVIRPIQGSFILEREVTR